MGRNRHRIAWLLAAAVFALPAPAWGQSAGDDQYQDPFAPGQDETETGGGSGDGSTGSADDQQAGGETAEPAAPAAAEPAAATQSQVSDGQQELPRTGADAGWLALSGTLLLGGGLALRVRLSEPARRRR